MDPCVASVCSNLAGIHAALRRVRAEPHTMDDFRRYQQVRGGNTDMTVMARSMLRSLWNSSLRRADHASQCQLP